MNEYRGKHSPSSPWALSSSASTHYRSRHLRKNRRRRILITAGIVLALVLCLLPFLEARILQVDRITMTSEDLPADIGRLRVVFLSDVHYGYFFSDGRVRSLISAVNNLKPDLVFFGGDIGDTPDAAVAFFKHLPSLHVRYGAYGVLGEADHGEDDLERTMVTDAMREAGVIPLVNAVLPVRIGTSMIYAAGLDDALKGKPALSALSTQTDAGDFVILVSHNPSVIPDAHRAADRSGRLGWFDLALFGHTHGGQIRGFSGLFDFGGDIEDRYLSGWMMENRANLLISNGVGTSILPARMLCPPQIHCIDISRP